MEKALSQLLYGFVFIFLAIRIGVDLLADPIGYLLIAVGCLKLSEEYTDGKIASTISMILIFFSIPSVLIDFNVVESGPWHYYSNLLFAGEVVLSFYLFRMLMNIAEAKSKWALKERTLRLFRIYIPANLLMLALGAVLTVFSFESLQILSFILVIGLLVLNITFIFLLAAFRKMARESLPPLVILKDGSIEAN